MLGWHGLGFPLSQGTPSLQPDLLIPAFICAAARKSNKVDAKSLSRRPHSPRHSLFVFICRCPCHHVQCLMRQKRCIECSSKTYKAAYPLRRTHITVWDSALRLRSAKKVVGAWLHHLLHVSELSLLCLGIKVTARKMIIHSTSCVT